MIIQEVEERVHDAWKYRIRNTHDWAPLKSRGKRHRRQGKARFSGEHARVPEHGGGMIAILQGLKQTFYTYRQQFETENSEKSNASDSRTFGNES
jgi:hypothetical protein